MESGDKNLAKADEKFFFHMNNFDDDAVEEEVQEEAPPPVYSEAELNAATKAAHAQGRAEALKESEESRDQFIAGLMEKIAMQTQALFAQEASRESTYEREAVALALSVFEKTFPVYHNKHGFAELQDQLLGILKSQEGLKSIDIRVSAAYADGVDGFVAKLREKDDGLRLRVIGDDAIADGTVHVTWTDGGAVRDPHALADQIKDRIQEILAGAGVTSHDDGIEKIVETHADQTDTEQGAESDAPEDILKEPNNE